jgi:hypothetical protein
MKNIRKNLVFGIAMSSVLSLSSCVLFLPANKTFSENGISITTNADFTLSKLADYDFYLESNNVLIIGSRAYPESYFTLSETIRSYAKIIIAANSPSENILIYDYTNDESELIFCYFTYFRTAEGINFAYYATTWKSSTSFYLIQFICESSNIDKYLTKFNKWALTIELE